MRNSSETARFPTFRRSLANFCPKLRKSLIHLLWKGSANSDFFPQCLIKKFHICNEVNDDRKDQRERKYHQGFSHCETLMYSPRRIQCEVAISLSSSLTAR